MVSASVAVIDYAGRIRAHYSSVWGGKPAERHWDKGPVSDLPDDFSVLEFPPSPRRKAWTYATCAMSQPGDDSRLELHLLAPAQDRAHVELLTVIAHFHRTGSRLGLGHSVNFGRPWLPGSACTQGLISLPYLDGPALEVLQFPIGEVRFLWLIPVTEAEVAYRKQNGTEALEDRFESASFNYLDPSRASVV